MRTGERGDSVVVTGASKGIGLETSVRLAAAGFRVWAGVRDAASGEIVESHAHRAGVRVNVIQLDVTDAPSVERAIARIVDEDRSLYAVVNNAGITYGGYFEDLTEAEVRRVLDVNLFGAMNVTRQVLPIMRAAGRGRVVMMSSYCGRIGTVAAAPYVASKFALEGWGESLALEVRPFGIDVVILEPGIIATKLVDGDRGIGMHARDSRSPYAEWFRRAEDQMDELIRGAGQTASDVAEAVHRAITVRRPRLRYVVGRRARILVNLRQRVPDALFERVYFGEMLRRVTGSRHTRASMARIGS